jgi:hypothetical protein
MAGESKEGSNLGVHVSHLNLQDLGSRRGTHVSTKLKYKQLTQVPPSRSDQKGITKRSRRDQEGIDGSLDVPSISPVTTNPPRRYHRLEMPPTYRLRYSSLAFFNHLSLSSIIDDVHESGEFYVCTSSPYSTYQADDQWRPRSIRS